MALPNRNAERIHHCLPRSAQACPTCGELMALPSFCAVCGDELTPVHRCQPRPLAHVCAARTTQQNCLACGQMMSSPRFCLTCGAEITPSHQCSATSTLEVRRLDPIHKCPVLLIERCTSCGESLPAEVYCGSCGMDITPPHVCHQPNSDHVCSPLVTMPHRCAHCGEYYPSPQHCAQCGADLTPSHICAT